MKLDSILVPGKRSYPPRVSAFTQPYWNGLTEGKWQTTCCSACGKFTFPPKPICPYCWSETMVWKELSARGTLYSWTRIHAAPSAFKDEVPYAVCVVDLDVGLRIATRLVDRKGIEFRPGIAVELIVMKYEDGPLLASRPL